MKKSLLPAGVIVCGLLLIIVVAAVVINGRGGDWPWESMGTLLKEEQVGLPNGARLTVKTDAMDIELFACEGEQLRIRQYGVDSSSLFTVGSDDDSVTIQARQRLRLGFHLPHDERLEIEIPSSWLGDMGAETSSGRLRLNDAFSWQEVALISNSGDIIIESELKADNLRLSNSSGSIRAFAALNIAGDCSISVNSGGIHVDEALTARELFGHTNSGDISLATATVEQFELRSSSGNIRADGISGSGSCLANSGSINLHLLEPLGDISIRASSSRIGITVQPELAFNFEGRCTSGSIHTDFPVDEQGKGKYVSGSVGDNPTANIAAEVNSGRIHISRDL